MLDLLERTGKPDYRDAVVVMIYGTDGKGTKNGSFRSVPMLPRTRGILKRRLEDESRASGRCRSCQRGGSPVDFVHRLRDVAKDAALCCIRGSWMQQGVPGGVVKR